MSKSNKIHQSILTACLLLSEFRVWSVWNRSFQVILHQVLFFIRSWFFALLFCLEFFCLSVPVVRVGNLERDLSHFVLGGNVGGSGADGVVLLSSTLRKNRRKRSPDQQNAEELKGGPTVDRIIREQYAEKMMYRDYVPQTNPVRLLFETNFALHNFVRDPLIGGSDTMPHIINYTAGLIAFDSCVMDRHGSMTYSIGC